MGENTSCNTAAASGSFGSGDYTEECKNLCDDSGGIPSNCVWYQYISNTAPGYTNCYTYDKYEATEQLTPSDGSRCYRKDRLL